LSELLFASPFATIVLFVAVLVSDSLLTVRGARLYKAGAQAVIALEGSYELNPRFAEDVDRLRVLSPRFLIMLALYAFVVWAVWYLTVGLSWLAQAYPLFVGAILLPEGPIHIRHIRNIVAFRRAIDREGVEGRIQYTRRFSRVASAVELLSFSVLYLVLALLCGSSLLLGGGLGTAGLALRGYQASRKSASEARGG
jgi:hypothetical protein